MNAEASVDLRNTIVVFPNDTKLEDPFGNLDNVQGLLVLRVFSQERLQTLGKFV